MRPGLLVLLTFLVGCGVTHSSTFYGPHGEEYHYVECRGLWPLKSSCSEHAEKTCPGGYDLVSPHVVETILGKTITDDDALAFRCKAEKLP